MLHSCRCFCIRFRLLWIFCVLVAYYQRDIEENAYELEADWTLLIVSATTDNSNMERTSFLSSTRALSTNDAL